MLDKLTVEHFHGCEQDSFWATTDKGIKVAFILKEVEALPIHPGHPMGEDARKPFSLMFQGPVGVVMEQGVVELENEVFNNEKCAIFLVAIGEAEERGALAYQAIFN